MKMRKALSAFLAIVCVLSMFSLFALGAFAEGERTVYATTSTTVQQGSYGYLYVYLDDLTDLSALNISIYYDADKVTVKNAYNNVSATVYDITQANGCVNASYIFDGKGGATKTNLFYIYYQVNSSAEVGDTYFDIVVTEAYDNYLKDISFSGSRCAFTVTEKPVTKSCSIYSTSSVSTSVGEEFELNYRLSTYSIASGSMAIQYDPELFEAVSVTNGAFLTGKISDVNTELDGSVYLSFVGTSYQNKYDLVTVRFKTLKNVTETSDIKLTVSELCDIDLNPYTCNGYTSKVNIAFDETYTEDAPSMSVNAAYSEETGKVTAVIELEKDSMLGAGDFVLNFDPDVLTYVSVQKYLDSDFFIINDNTVSEGVLKFYILSSEDIVNEQTVLTVTFDVKHECMDKIADLEISGSMLTDSLTNPIILNFVDTSVTVPLKHTESTAIVENKIDANCTKDGSYDSVIYCSECKAEVSRKTKIIDKLGHDYATEWTVDVEPTCTATGSKSHHCSRCDDKADVTEISTLGHDYVAVVTEPTCTEKGYTTHTCSRCNDTYTDSETKAFGHTAGAEADCLNDQICTVCGEVLVEKLGHDYKVVITDPTCTTEGYTTHTCSRCSDTYTDATIEPIGHTASDWIIDLEPASDVEGTKHTECTICGEILETAVIEALPVETEPETVPKTEPETETKPDAGIQTELAPPYESDSKQEEPVISNGCSSIVSANIFCMSLMLSVAALFFAKRKKENL